MRKQFVYIDSSEQEESYNIRPVQHIHDEQKQNPITHKNSPHKNRRCIAHNPQSKLLKQSQYDFLIKNLLSDKITSEMTKQLITKIQDYELAHNIEKRNSNNKYFIQRMQIDQKYQAMQQEKADRLKAQNQRKKQVLYRHQSQKQMRKQEDEIKKYIVEKQQKQGQVVHNIKKQIRKLGFERVYNAHKRLKQEMIAKKIKKEHEIVSELNKQKNQILELQQQFQAIKQAKRINKIQQRKVIKQLTQKVLDQKAGLNVKLKVRPFQV